MNNQHTSRAQVVPTRWFAEEFEDRFEKLVAAAQYEDDRKHGFRDSGVIGEIGRYAADTLGVAETAMPRKIYAIRKCDFATLHVSIAEALLDAMNSSLRDADVPILAGHESGAREMIDGYCYATETEMSLFEQRSLAKKLHHFSRGLIMAMQIDIDEIAAAVAVGEFLKAFAPEKIKLAEAA